MSSMADDLLDMLPHLITIEAYTSSGTDGYNEPTYAGAKTYHAYVGEEMARIVGTSGEQIVSTGVVYFHPKSTTDNSVLTALSDKSRITLPDGTKPRLLKVGSLDDEQGATLWQARF